EAQREEREAAEWRDDLRAARDDHRAQPRGLLPRQQDDVQAGRHREARGSDERVLLRSLRRVHDRRLGPRQRAPLGPAVRHGDDRWFDVVKWTLFAMIEAEEMGLTTKTIEQAASSKDPAVQR